VSRRRRALLLLAAALLCALLAATVARRYRSQVEGQYGPLRPVLVTAAELPAGQTIGPGAAVVVRRVPAAFVPPGALRRPRDAVGRAPGATLPAGSYVLGSQLAVPEAAPTAAPGAGRGRRPVQLPVNGAEALLLGGASPEGGRVDVVVSQRAGLGGSAKTYVAAEGVRLLALAKPAGPGESWSATLALSREQALDLIGAQGAGRELRLLPRP
jgi:pilus assembly protein CpaB